jgi:hypothetical protein
MKKLLVSLLFAPLFAFAQNTSEAPAKAVAVDSVEGTRIEYDILRRVDGQNIKIMVVTDGGGGGGQEPEVQMPSTVNMNQIVGISAKGAVLGEPAMPMPKWAGNGAEGPDMERIIIKPVQESFLMDFAKRQWVQVMRSEHDPEKKTYCTLKDFSTPKDWKEGKKTKKIAGYECKKHTCTLEDLEYTVWVSTELEGSFSPKPELFPPGKGVVLAFESDDLSYTAKNISLNVKVPAPSNTPADAVTLTPAEMNAKRMEFVQKAMPGGGGVRMIRRN